MTDLRAPFPYFGGKSRAADLVWTRFGQVVNYVEPFFGSGAVLLQCPANFLPRVETVNDINGFVSNFWRATKAAPEAVASAADYPVIETDLHARHRWLLAQARELRARLDADPTYFDARIAGWWVWGASAWIGSGWCEEGRGAVVRLPSIGGMVPEGESRNSGGGRGIHAAGMRAPSTQLPNLGSMAPKGEVRYSGGGRGIHSAGMRLPGLSSGTDEPNARAGRDVHSATVRGPSRQLPRLDGNGGTEARGPGKPGGGAGVHGFEARTALYDIFARLSARLRYTRVACGDWTRIVTPAVTYRHGLTGVFLDPPYDGYEQVYGAEGGLSSAVRAWASEAGKREDMRIALCGYEGEHDSLEQEGWEVVAWKAKGGYANQRTDGENENSRRERIWFSPACRLSSPPAPKQASLFTL